MALDGSDVVSFSLAFRDRVIGLGSKLYGVMLFTIFPSISHSDFFHTGNLEVFHSLLLKYCPKRLHFSFHGMIARTQLAILHFNQAMKSEQAVTRDRIRRYKHQFSKITKKYVIKPINNAPEKLYIEHLISEVINAATINELHKPILPDIPNRHLNKPDKEEEIKKRYSRFYCKQ